MTMQNEVIDLDPEPDAVLEAVAATQLYPAHVVLPLAPPRRARESPEERNRRKWSMAMSDHLRRTLRYAWTTEDAILQAFADLNSVQLKSVLEGNHRMETRRDEQGVLWVRGLRSTNSSNRS